MKSYLKDFVNRKGHLIFSASLINRFLTIISSIVVVRLISKEVFGFVTYANTLVGLLIPFVGLGLNHALLRYGSIEKSQTAKMNLYLYSLKFGLIGSFFLTLLLIIASGLLTNNLKSAQIYLIILSFGLVTQYLFLLQNSYFRVLNLNKAYAKLNIYNSVLLLVLVVLFSFFGDGIGYVYAIVISPLLIFVLSSKTNLIRLYKSLIKIKLDFSNNKNFLYYGLFIGFGAAASQMVLITDNLIIANIIKDASELAGYRVGSIIPMGLMFIPTIFLSTDFVVIAKNDRSKSFLISYVKNYMKLFTVISVLLFGTLYLFSESLTLFLFGDGYQESVLVFKILLPGIASVFLLRAPFGNILNAVGKAKWNVYNGFILLFLNGMVSYLLTVKYGLIGAAVASSSMLVVGGLISMGLFFYYLRKI